MGIVKFRKGKVAKYTARIGYKDGRTKLIITFVLTFNYIISTRLIFSVSSATSLAAGHVTEMCTGLGKRGSLGCVNSHTAARGSQEAGFTEA